MDKQSHALDFRFLLSAMLWLAVVLAGIGAVLAIWWQAPVGISLAGIAAALVAIVLVLRRRSAPRA